jgi:hypothetical protein
MDGAYDMTLKHLLAGAAVAAFMIAGTAAKAQTINLGNETDAGGFVGDLFQGQFIDHVTVASDGENTFDPFNAGYDTSDGIDFSGQIDAGNWIQATDSHWNVIGGGQTWVLPANLGPCGSENEPICEPVGHWILPGATWAPGALGVHLIYDSDGVTLSDRIDVFQTNVGAEVRFASDPIGIPEPATWTIMLTGFFGLGAMLRRRQAAVA